VAPILIGLALAAIALTAIVPRINELFLISIRRGQLLLVRGNVPTGVLRDFTEIAERAKIQAATIRAVKTATNVRLKITGIEEGTTQQLRNVFGIHPLSKLRAAPALPAQRNFGQRLGWIWLSWLLSSRGR
jgi:hypothetical protein